MRLTVHGKHLEVTDSIRDHVNQKIGKAVGNFENLITKVDVNVSAPQGIRGPSQQVAEVTTYVNGTVVRAQETHENLYASIDLVSDKIARQLKKYKDRHQRRSHVKEAPPEPVDATLLPTELTRDRTPELPAEVIRNKFFAMPPMSVEEALGHLQLVDHDFYMFCNSETGEINVIYERNHGGYGLLQPRETSAAE